MSITSIRPFIAKPTSIITLDEVDDDIVRAIDEIKRKDIITKDYINKLLYIPLKTYLNNFLKTKEISLNNLDSKNITFGSFWDYQLELFKTKELNKEKKNKPTHLLKYFTLKNIETLTNFFSKHGKKEDFEEFINNIPIGRIRHPLDELFTVMCKIINEETPILDITINGGRKIILNKQQQDQWKLDMIKYFYSFKEIEELNKGSFYQEEIIKHGTFINTLMNIEEKGVGCGEILICYLFKGAIAQGGAISYDIVFLNGKIYEVKSYINDKRAGIKLGKEGNLTKFPFWQKIQKTIHVVSKIMINNQEILEQSLSEYFFTIWKCVINDKKNEESYNKVVAAGIQFGEISNTNLAILKMWYFLAHELVLKSKYEKTSIPEDVITKLDDLYYVRYPEKLDDDLENVSIIYFEENSKLNAFIIFRPNKVNIIKKGEFVFYNITQAAVKFLETDISKKTESIAKTAFLEWKLIIKEIIQQFDCDKEIFRYAIRKIRYEDFYYNLQDVLHNQKYESARKKEFEVKYKRWSDRYQQMFKSIQKIKTKEIQEKKKTEWLIKNSEPILKIC